MTTIQYNIPLAQYSTFEIGGHAREFVEVKTPDELVEVVSWAKVKKKSYKLFAGGSNVVFPDKGIDGLVIRVIGGNLQRTDTYVVSDTGVRLEDLVNLANNYGLQGMEKLVGIPGTVGGAVVGNAGAYGVTIADRLVWVDVWDGKERKKLTKGECEFSYRESVFKHTSWIICKVAFNLVNVDKRVLQKMSQEILSLRLSKYKPGLKCPGSFFKNIPVELLTTHQLEKIGKDHMIWGKVPAGYLLDQVGARGMRVGRISIADFHGNLFINDGGGRANEVKNLASVLKKGVYERFGVKLEEEIRYF